jgi:hypothetical protein
MLGDTLKGPINLSFIHHRAVFHTTAATGAKIHIYTARPLSDFHLEISFLSGDAFYFRKGKQFNVNVPADLDQFGGNNSHGTVIGWKGLVKLRHHPAYGAGFFNQVDIKTGIGQVQS